MGCLTSANKITWKVKNMGSWTVGFSWTTGFNSFLPRPLPIPSEWMRRGKWAPGSVCSYTTYLASGAPRPELWEMLTWTLVDVCLALAVSWLSHSPEPYDNTYSYCVLPVFLLHWGNRDQGLWILPQLSALCPSARVSSRPILNSVPLLSCMTLGKSFHLSELLSLLIWKWGNVSPDDGVNVVPRPPLSPEGRRKWTVVTLESPTLTNLCLHLSPPLLTPSHLKPLSWGPGGEGGWGYKNSLRHTMANNSGRGQVAFHIPSSLLGEGITDVG